MSMLEIETTPFESLPVSSGTTDAAWFALQTRSRTEKKVASQLGTKGVETFLPLVTEVHRWSDRQQSVHQPLFPGYVFVRIAESSRLRLSILNTMGVCGFVGIQGVGLPIPDKEIRDIRTIVANPASFAPYPFLRAGQRVRVRGGCLDGIEGTLVSANSDRSVVVSVELVRRAVAVRINGYDVELI